MASLLANVEEPPREAAKLSSGPPIKSLSNDGLDVISGLPKMSLSINGVEEPLCEAAKWPAH